MNARTIPTLGDQEWRFSTVQNVRNSIARSILAASPDTATALGEISLKPHQLDASRRIQLSIHQLGGALLADEVGLGKTFVALAVAREYAHTTILAPAALQQMWRDAIRTAHSSGVRVQSLHALSRPAFDTPSAPAPVEHRALVIVDEAHHLRTRTTRRYQRAAQLCAERDVLLLSATPLHNKPNELRSLLALFLGNRADILDAHTLAMVVIRRTHNHLGANQLPILVEHAPNAIPDNPPVLEAILTLPPPLPAHDGSAAGALIRLGLLRAWCSSDAALTDTLRKRRLRGEALLHALAHGRHPTHAELRTWTTGTDSVQLGFPELLVQHTVNSVEHAAPLMLTQVTTHLDALERLERLHLRTCMADSHRCAMLREMLHEDPRTPILAFSQFSSTVQALFRALGDLAGIAALTSRGGRVAGGPIARHELIARFAPRAHERPPPPQHESIRLLLTTDVLSEGINLQDAGRLVHLDLPWTSAARAQRVGRLRRIGSLHSHIHVHTLAPPHGADRTLKIVATLERKARISRQLIGTDSLAANNITLAEGESTRVQANSAADDATTLRSLLASWICAPRMGISSHHASVMPIAIVHASVEGWIAAVRCNTETQLWASILGVPHASPAELVRALTFANASVKSCSHDHAADVRKSITQLRTRLLDAQVAQMSGPSPNVQSLVRRALLERIAQLTFSAPAARRSQLVARAVEAERVAMLARGAGAEVWLQTWLDSYDSSHSAGVGGDWIDKWRTFPVLAASASFTQLVPEAHAQTVAQQCHNVKSPIGSEPPADNGIVALLVLVPPASEER